MLSNNKISDVNAITHYGREYQRVEKKLIGQSQEHLSRLRRTALAAFSMRGFPSKKQADWKYTSLAALRQTPYSFAPTPCNATTTMLELSPSDYRLVFLNGFFVPQLSRVTLLTGTSILSNLSYMLDQQPEQLSAAWKPKETIDKNSFTDLNTAFMQDGAYIYLSANTRLSSPIEILFINTDEASNRFIPLRNIIIAEENSQATIIEKYIDMTPGGNANYFLNTVSECHLAANSHIEHYKSISEAKQAQHVSHLYVTQQKNSQFLAYSLALSGALIRSDVTVKLVAAQAYCQLKGLYYALGQQQVDHCTLIEHISPNTRSEEFYKGVIADRARAVFNGKLIVRERATQSKAQQLNKNLLLSAHAEVNSKPQLEIFTDDIQCTHGASIGQLDKDALFYLRTRGLTTTAATDLLVNAFIQDILEQMPLFSGASLPSLMNKYS
ncbi:MAG: Fe-S cluster assembly protein SufD [Candidatus Aquirickettsiella sp.]